MDRDDIVDRITSKGVQFTMDCIKSGYEDYNNPEYYSAQAKRDHTPSVAAACINSHIIGRAKRMTVDMQPLIKINQKRNRTTFILADHTEIWFKKLNKDGKPSYRVSKQAIEYLKSPENQPLLDLEMPPSKQQWLGGYRSSSVANTEYEIIISAPQKDGNFWEVCLSGTEVQELFPAADITSVPAATTEIIKKRVQVRKPKEREQ